MPGLEWLAPLMFAVALLLIFSGYPVAFSLGGTSLIFAVIGVSTGYFDWHLMLALPDRLFGIMSNYTLLAVPFFIFMGTMLEKSNLARDLLHTTGLLFGPLRGGLAIAVILVGVLLAAATGIVGANVVAMGMISLPIMLKPEISTLSEEMTKIAENDCLAGSLVRQLPIIATEIRLSVLSVQWSGPNQGACASPHISPQ